MIKKFLIVGFGGMGCRHTQSLVNLYKDSIVYIFEPNYDTYKKNLDIIGESSNKNIFHISTLNDIKSEIDFCVVATSSEPRFQILKELLNYDINHFLVEKVVFQSKNQFDKIEELIGDQSIYVNFVNRYFKNYIKIKNDIKKQPFSIDIIGGEFGLGCNALHYFDLFKYFGASSIYLDKYNLKLNDNINKRGNQYKEVLGQISLKSNNNSSLNISSDLERKDVEISIKYNNKTHIINEGLLTHLQFLENEIRTNDFMIEYTSVLTAKIYNDILNSKCLLPKIQETKDIHLFLFESINKSIDIDINEICPIT